MPTIARAAVDRPVRRQPPLALQEAPAAAERRASVTSNAPPVAACSSALRARSANRVALTATSSVAARRFTSTTSLSSRNTVSSDSRSSASSSAARAAAMSRRVVRRQHHLEPAGHRDAVDADPVRGIARGGRRNRTTGSSGASARGHQAGPSVRRPPCGGPSTPARQDSGTRRAIHAE